MTLAPAVPAAIEAALAYAVAGVVVGGASAPRLSCRRAGEGDAAGRHVAGELLAVDGGAHLRFTLPDRAVDFVRVEPAAIPGSYCIVRFTCAGIEVGDLARRVVAVSGRLLRAGSGVGLSFESEQGRPAVELDVRGLFDGDGGPVIEMLLRREGDAAAALRASTALAEAMARTHDDASSGHAGLARGLAGVSARLDDVDAGLAGLAGLASSVERLADHVAGLGESVPALAGQLNALAGQMAVLAQAEQERDRRLERLEHRLTSLESLEQGLAELGRVAARSATEASIGELRATMAVFAEAASAARMTAAGEATVLHERVAAVQERLDRLVHAVENVFWRRWLRRLRGALR